MSAAPWVCEVFTGATAIAAFGGEYPSTEARKIRAASARNMSGRVLTADDFADRTIALEAKTPAMLDVAVINGQFLLASPELIAEMQAFDLGQSQFFETAFFARDGKTELPFQHHYWNIGNAKDSFVPAQVPSAEPVTKDPSNSMFGVYFKPMTIADGEIVLTPDSLDGPDVWVESKLRGVLFLSDRLARKLQSEEMSSGFEMSQCRIADVAR